MSRPPHDPAHGQAARGEHVQALLMLLPAAVLAWPGPGSYLIADWQPAATGSAAVLLWTLPALVVLVWRRHAGAARGWYLLLPLLGTLAQCAPHPSAHGGSDGSDDFELRRALFLVLAAMALLVCGASLGRGGRTTLARGLACLSVALTLVAHFDAENRFAGALGNTGSVSQAALAGAVLSGVLLAGRWSAWSLVDLAALGLQAAYVARAPVFAGALAAAAGLGAFALLASSALPRSRVFAGAMGASIVLLALFLPRSGAVPEAVPPAAAAPARAGDTGGFAVRKLVWTSTLGLIAEHPLLGAGLGQFAREFPPHRAPAEIERSSHQRRLAQETEVEHAHCDYLTLLAEAGLVWSASVFALLALVLASAVRILRGPPGINAALAAAAVALLVNGLVHGVLFHDPVSASIAFGLFGALLGPVQSPRPRLARKLVPAFLLVVLAIAAPSAVAMLRHAEALAPIERGQELSSSGTEEAIESALTAAPDSALALTLRARLLETRAAQADHTRSAWRAVVALRPFRVEARMQLGLAELRAGDLNAAARSWTTARELDPGHPGLAWNLMTLALDEDRAADAEPMLAELDAAQRLDQDRLLSLATRLELECKEASAGALWRRIAPEIADAGPDKCFQLSRARKAAGDERLANALELRAQRGYAREHARQGAWTDAVRSYRQALRVAADPAPVRLRVEYAAALAAAGKPDEARAELASIEGWPRAIAYLPAWAKDELAEPGWVPR